MEQREKEVNALKDFRNTLKNSLSTELKHSKELQFMAESGFRQLGEPRIWVFADRQRPEPMHLEINNWQHLLNLLYKEAIQRNKIEEFIAILKQKFLRY